jgi:glycosyltransferase involved in cell wall biosynthesis
MSNVGNLRLHSLEARSSDDSPIRLAILAMNPVPYHSTLYRSICSAPEFDGKVIYLDTVGLEGIYEKDFGTKIEWDIPLLDGYDFEFVSNYARNKESGAFSRINPGLPGVLKRGRFDAILIQGYSIVSFWVALFAARRLGTKVIWRGEVTLKHGDTSRGIRRRVRDAIVKSFLKRCDAVMYTCAGNRDFLLHHGISNEELHPFLCAVDNDRFRAEFKRYAPQSTQIRRELGIPEGNVIVLFCGRLTQRKRPFDVLEAIQKAGSRQLSFVIMGDGPQRGELLDAARTCDIHTVFLGFVNQSEISRYYTIADVFCLLSEYDPSPKALNEAMNCMLVPVVSDTIGTAGDLVIDGETGFQVALGDTDEVAARIAQLRDNGEMRQRMAERSLERVSHFSFASDVAGLEAACRAALQGRRVPPSSADV